MRYLDPQKFDVGHRVDIDFSEFPLDALVKKKAYKLHKIEIKDLPVYEHLLWPPSWEQFSKLYSLDQAILYGISCLNHPLGLLVASKRRFDNNPLILTLCVDKQYRGQGIGRCLIKALESEYTQKQRLHMWTQTLLPEQLDSYHRFFASCGYTANPHTFLHCSGTANTMRLRLKKLPIPAFDFIPWKELKSGEENEILLRLAQENLTGLNPFFYGKDATDFNSFVVRKGSLLVGWAVNTFVTPQHIHYGSYYLIPEYRSTGLGGYLINYCLQMHSYHIDKYPYWSTCFLTPLNAHNRHNRYFLRFASEKYTRQEWYKHA